MFRFKVRRCIETFVWTAFLVLFLVLCSALATDSVRQSRPKTQSSYFESIDAKFLLAEGAASPSAQPRQLPETFCNSVGLEFCRIDPGSFLMGNGLTPEALQKKYPYGKLEWYEAASPQRKVTLTETFYMCKYETTVGDFRKFVDATRYKTTAEKERTAFGFDNKTGTWKEIAGLTWRSPGFEQSSQNPVTCVSWEDAQAYIKWLNETAEFDAKLGAKPQYRLPTEAEWEYCCRAGTRTEFFWGSDPAGGEGFLNAADESGAPNGRKWNVCFPFKSGYVTTAPVGSFKPNPWGLHDMLGNVWEWCEDRFDANWYKNSKTTNPLNNETKNACRVLRGGSWSNRADYCQSAYRNLNDPSNRYGSIGLRLVLISR